MEKVVRKYDVIYTRLPWQYRVWTNENGERTAPSHYSTPSLDCLSRIYNDLLCNPTCVLFLCAIFPCLQEAPALGQAWGFKYKTQAFVWIKQNKNITCLFLGMGHYTRVKSETVSLFTKGKPLKRVNNNVLQVFISPRGKHSQKLSEIRRCTENLFGNRPYLELFARSRDGLYPELKYEGWDVFGNEANHSIPINLNQNLFLLKV